MEYRRIFVWAVLSIALLGYGIVLARQVGAYAGGADSSGYLNHARLLAAGRLHVATREIPELREQGRSPWLYAPHGLRPAQDGNGIVPTYPSGLPLLIAATALFIGWPHAAGVVLWVHALGGVILTYLLARRLGFSFWLAVAAAAVIATSPLYMFLSVWLLSDVPAMAWVALAVLIASSAEGRVRLALASGAAFGFAVLIRPTNALALFACLIALGRPGRSWTGFALGAIPAAMFFVGHAHAAYAQWLTTGYGDRPEWDVQLMALTAAHYARWLPLLFTPLVAAFVALPFVRAARQRCGWLLLAWVLPFVVFYAGYPFTHRTWWYLRFLLPAAPAFVIGAMMVCRDILRPRPAHAQDAGVCLATSWSGGRMLAAAALIVLCIAVDAYMLRHLRPWRAGRQEAPYAEASHWLTEHAPANAVVATMQTSGALFYYTPLAIARWDWLHADDFPAFVAALIAAGRPLYAMLVPFELENEHALHNHMPYGEWSEIKRIGEVRIYRWSPPGTAASPAR